jgi:hypothetical protein
VPRYVNLANLQQFAAINLTSDPGYDRADHRIPNCAQITLRFLLGSGSVANVVTHGSYNGGFSGSQAQANAILTALSSGAQWTALAPHLAPTVNFFGVSIRDLNAEDQPIIDSNVPGGSGTSSGTELPDEVAVVVTKRTAFTGPEHRGRMYIPGWATTALGANNTVAAATVTALGNWASIVAGVYSNSGYTFCIGHRHRLAYTSAAGTPIPERLAGTVPITNVAVRDNHWDSQRRRGLK